MLPKLTQHLKIVEFFLFQKNQYQRLQKSLDEYHAAQEALQKGLDGSEKKLKAFAFSVQKLVYSFAFSKLFD